MAVLTRSRARAAAGGGPNGSHTPAPQSQTNADVHENVVQGANGNRVSTRGRGMKRSSAQTQQNSIEGEGSASTASRLITASNSKPRRNDNGESQPQAVVQSSTQTCGLAFKFTLEHVATPSKAASPPKTDGAASKKPRKGGRSTTKRGPKAKAKAKAKTGGAGQQKKGSQSTAVARAGTKRRREEDEYEPEEFGGDELEPAPVRRTLRRVRRKTQQASAEDDVSNDAVGEAMKRVRRNKGKAKAVDLPPTEEATTGSKRRRDEDDDVGDDSQQPLDPGPSRRTTRRTRQKVDKPTVSEPEKKTTSTRKPRGSDARPTRRTGKRTARKIQAPLTRTSTPMSCESEEPTFMPSRAPSPEECKEHPTPQEAPREAVVKQEEVTPSPFPRQPPSRQPECKREPPVSPFMLPALQIPSATVFPFANPTSHVGGLIIKAEERSSPYPDQDESLSPGGSDKENDPIYGPLPAPMPAPEPDSDEDDDTAQDECGTSDQSIQRPHPRRPLEPLEGFDTSVPEGDETEPVSSEDEEVDYIDLDEVDSAPVTPSAETRITTAQCEVPSCRYGVDGPNDEVEVASEVRELLEASSSFYRRMTCRDLDQVAPQEHESPVSPVAGFESIPDTPSVPFEAAVPDGRDRFTRSRAPSPSPSLPDHATQYLHTPEGSFPLPPCQCGNPARHFVVHSDGEASEYSFMGDDEGL